jgi:hypothetical protein
MRLNSGVAAFGTLIISKFEPNENMSGQIVFHAKNNFDSAKANSYGSNDVI